MFRENVKKVLAFGVALIMIALVVTGCGGNDTGSGNDNAGGTNDAGSGETTGGGAEGGSGRNQVTVALTANPIALDVHLSNDNPSTVVSKQIFETLVIQDENLQHHPGLATDWRQIDEYTWEFDLRSGVIFHNGDEMTADDVVFSLRRGSDEATKPLVSPILGMIDGDSVEAIDRYTVRIGTLMPFAPLPNHLAHTAAAIMSERAIEEATDSRREPVGTGPFRFVSWLNEDYIELARFDDYHGELPQFETLMLRIITEPSSRVVELETGSVDVIMGVGTMDFARVEEDANLTLLTVPGLQTNYVGLNTNHEHLGNRLVRQAMNYAVNVEDIRTALAFGHGDIARGPITSNVFGFNPDLVGYPFNLERAQELMREAGLEDGFDMTLYISSNQANIDLAQAVQAQLAAININVGLNPLEWGTFIDAVSADGGVDAFMMGWGSITGDADYGIFPLFHTMQHGEAGNRTFFTDDRVDYLLEAARATIDPDERLAMYFEIQEIIVEEAPWIFLLQPLQSLGTRAEVRGLNVDPTNAPSFAGIYFAE